MSKLKTIQQRAVKWICVKSVAYRENLKVLGILPLPRYVQLNNLLLFSKWGMLPRPTILHRVLVRQFVSGETSKENQMRTELHAPNLSNCECVNFEFRERIGLKQRLLKIFWSKFEQYNESDKCTWKLACDCTTNNCRNRTVIWS